VSLILEALRKSEEEDQAPKTPTLYPAFYKANAHQAKSFANRRNAIGIFAMLAGLLVLGVAYRSSLTPSDYFQHGEGGKKSTSPNLAVESNITHHLSQVYATPLESDLATPKLLEKQHASTSPQISSTNLNLPHSEPNTTITITQAVVATHIEEPFLPQRKEQETARDIAPQVTSASSELYLLDTPNIKEVSPQIQKQLPQLRYESHWYDKQPSKRTVIINSHNLKEGGRLSHNLRVHSITKDGCILSYKGVFFHMLMLQTWPKTHQATY